MEFDPNIVLTVVTSVLGVAANGGLLTWFLKSYLPRREKESADREARRDAETALREEKKDKVIETLRAESREERKAYLDALQVQGERYDQIVQRVEKNHRDDHRALMGRLDGVTLGLSRLEAKVRACPHGGESQDQPVAGAL